VQGITPYEKRRREYVAWILTPQISFLLLKLFYSMANDSALVPPISMLTTPYKVECFEVYDGK
jgi:hypothetical protein